jgi:hypothetical protein
MGVIVVLPVKMMDSVDKLTRVYVNKVVRLNGIPISIVSDMDHDLLLNYGLVSKMP